jgi:hypothetical protein|uniref:Uncharacterized protein n=1 Tax=Zea mays TaxID=4577 RepID=A0A804R993_MAIZE
MTTDAAGIIKNTTIAKNRLGEDNRHGREKLDAEARHVVASRELRARNRRVRHAQELRAERRPAGRREGILRAEHDAGAHTTQVSWAPVNQQGKTPWGDLGRRLEQGGSRKTRGRVRGRELVTGYFSMTKRCRNTEAGHSELLG